MKKQLTMEFDKQETLDEVKILIDKKLKEIQIRELSKKYNLRGFIFNIKEIPEEMYKELPFQWEDGTWKYEKDVKVDYDGNEFYFIRYTPSAIING